MQTYAIEYVYDARTDLRDQVRPEHRRFLGALVESGSLLASGPWTGPRTDLAEQPDGALLLVRAASAQDAAALLDEDPFVLHGLVTSRTLRPWNPVLGPWA